MAKLVYAVFNNPTAAQAAMDGAGVGEATESTVVHRPHMREEDVQLAGSEAFLSGLVGGLAMGALAGLAAVLLILPGHGLYDALAGGVMAAISASLFGVIAGGLAGASESKNAVRAEALLSARHGKTMVTCELRRRRDAALVIAAIEESGGEHVHAA